ncbi:MAG: IS66 family transposase [Actinobacteria bacterium]|nr:IS66 family transposase [Actinomycetota bacterium]
MGCLRCPDLEQELRRERAAHLKTMRELRARAERAEARAAELERELSRHSGNSSKPPSGDTLTERAAQMAERESRAERRRRARARAKEILRRGRERRRPGKQPGAQGRHLQVVERPDEVAVAAPERCTSCGADLGDAEVVGTERRQVFDLPEVRLSVTEHRAESRRCSCGRVTRAAFPPEATAPACYGPRVRALGCYLLARHHLPVERCAELLEDVLGAPVSTGWLCGIPKEAAAGLEPFLAEVREQLRQAAVLHVDETGARISGRRFWFHDVCTPTLTLIDCHPRRGTAATEDMGVLPEFSGIAVHDRWKPYFTYTACRHALCGAHLLRDLAAVAETPSQRGWAEAMADLLVGAMEGAADARDAGRDRLSPRRLRSISHRYDVVVALAFAQNRAPRGRERTASERASSNLARAFDTYKTEILRFAHDLRVAFDNNQAERDLRMVKLQQKISGCFRTVEGARAFCAIRSYLQTAAKQGVNLLGALSRLFSGDPWIPVRPRAP